MKILLAIHEHLDPNSGAAGSTMKLGQCYQEYGHDVRYFSFDDCSSKAFPGIKDLMFPYQLAKYLIKANKSSDFDVIDAATGDLWIWELIQKAWSSQTLLVTRSHGLEHLWHLSILEQSRNGLRNLTWKYFLYRGGIHLWEVYRSLKYADLVFLLNQEEADYARTEFSIPDENISVFPNGLPDSFLRLEFVPTPLLDNEDILIAQVGTYIARKGIQFSVPAMNRILHRYPQVKLTLLGTECRECSNVDMVYDDFDAAVREQVTVIGRYDHESLPVLLAGHHIKLFPTISEAFGKALVEGMACGLAPVTTSVAGPMEIVTPDHDALVVPPQDSEALEKALERLILDRNLLHRLRKNAYATAQGYSWKAIAAARLETYEQALQRKKDKS